MASSRGQTVNTLREQASNDDRLTHSYSRVRFPVFAGRRYRVAVDGAGGATGQVVLRWSFVPSF